MDATTRGDTSSAVHSDSPVEPKRGPIFDFWNEVGIKERIPLR